MPKGKYERTRTHMANISIGKLKSGYKHPPAVKLRIAASVKKSISKKKSG